MDWVGLIGSSCRFVPIHVISFAITVYLVVLIQTSDMVGDSLTRNIMIALFSSLFLCAGNSSKDSRAICLFFKLKEKKRKGQSCVRACRVLRWWWMAWPIGHAWVWVWLCCAVLLRVGTRVRTYLRGTSVRCTRHMHTHDTPQTTRLASGSLPPLVHSHWQAGLAATALLPSKVRPTDRKRYSLLPLTSGPTVTVRPVDCRRPLSHARPDGSYRAVSAVGRDDRRCCFLLWGSRAE